ncbi:MAG: hypothetical protein ABI652_08555, partial [Acidobacteriota bacterium]
LPLVVPVAGLAVVALAALGARVAAVGAVAIAIASLIAAQPRLQAYVDAGAPVFRAFQAMHTALPASPAPPVLRMHHQVWWGTQRAIEWYRPTWDIGPQPFPGDHEWLSVVDHFRGGGQRPVWFLAYIPRTDLAAFDPRTTRQLGRYEPPTSTRTLIGGTRLDSLSWWRLDRPGWMAATGWSLTPEIAGRALADRQGPQLQGADAYLLRSHASTVVMIGGRYLGPDNGPGALITATLDGQVVGEWAVGANPRWFVQWLDLPEGVPEGPGAYARLVVRATASGADVTVPVVGLEQFDAAAFNDYIYAFADGWHGQESDPAAALEWRWTTGRSALVVRGASTDLVLSLTGESPLKNFAEPAQVTVKAGDRVLKVFEPHGEADFSEQIALPAAALRDSSGRVTIETSRTFRPSDQGSADHRELGLRLFSVKISRPSAPQP